VTGSRTLLEALELGGPFLYFNGVLGSGRRRRRHRPEKIDAVLANGRSRGVAADLLRDLADFARGRRIASVVERAAARRGGWVWFPRELGAVEFPRPFDDAAELILGVARALAERGGDAAGIVRELRAASKG